MVEELQPELSDIRNCPQRSLLPAALRSKIEGQVKFAILEDTSTR